MRLGALTALLATGCSFAVVSTPKQRPAPPLTCKTDSVAPKADAVIGGLGLLLGGWAIIDDLTHGRGELEGVGYLIGLPLVSLGTLYGLSSVYGHVQTGRCRRFHRELGSPIDGAPAATPGPTAKPATPR